AATPSANSVKVSSFSVVRACNGVFDRTRRVQGEGASGASKTSRPGYTAERREKGYIPPRDPSGPLLTGQASFDSGAADRAVRNWRKPARTADGVGQQAACGQRGVTNNLGFQAQPVLPGKQFVVGVQFLHIGPLLR